MSSPHLNRNTAIISDLQQKLVTAVGSVCSRADSYALLDFPNHANVGDSAIYLGDLILLERLYGKAPAFIMETRRSDLDHLARKLPAGPIFLHGGGNFGDVWPKYQAFREEVIQRFPDRQIIQLPQTIHFSTQAGLEKSAALINQHKNFTLMVRDRNSQAIAEKHFTGQILLCPDTAFMIGPVTPPRAPAADIFCLLRTDKESAGGHVLAGAPSGLTLASGDWLDEPQMPTPMQRLQRNLERIPALKSVALDWRRAHYHDWASRRVSRGFELLSSGRVVVTDRLHAHILSVLLGKRHVALDNSYGKISSFIEAWTTGGDFATADTLPEALNMAAGQLAVAAPANA